VSEGVSGREEKVEVEVKEVADVQSLVTRELFFFFFLSSFRLHALSSPLLAP